MSKTRESARLLLDQLHDERTRRVVFVSHYLLNENTRYAGGATRPEAVAEVIDELIAAGYGIHQLPCPERLAWGGVLKRYSLRLYHSKARPLYAVRGVLLSAFLWWTKVIYGRLARQVARDVADYQRAGIAVVGIVGIGASPSCGVITTLDLRVSLEVAGGATVLVLLVAIPAAYYSARRKFKGRTVFLLLVLVTQMFQPTALVVGIYGQFNQLGMIDDPAALILVNAGFNMAFAIWILNAYFGAIPKELEEAALVDGNTRLGAMFRVIIPLALPGIVTALIFTFISAWNEFIVALTLTSTPSKEPLTVGLNNFIGAYSVDWQHLFAGSVIATIPVIILFALIERKVVSGLTAGSVK